MRTAYLTAMFLFHPGAAHANPGRASTATVSKDFPSSGLKSIEIRVSAGFIAVGRATEPKVSIQAVLKRWPARCRLDMGVSGDKLVLTARETRKSYYGLELGRDGCEVEFSIRAPQHLAIDAATGSGTLAVSSRAAKIAFKSGSGSLRLQDATGPVSAHIGSGGVEGAGLTEPAEVRTGSGSVALSWTRAPEQGEVSVKTGSGDVSLTFPAATQLEHSLKTGSGPTSSDLASESGAALKVAVRTGSGAARIKSGAK